MKNCERCGSKPAIVRLTRGAGPPTTLCLACASESAAVILPHAQMNPVTFWKHLANPRAPLRTVSAESLPSETTCTQCKLTFGEFAEIGLAGCGGCYATFREVILPALYDIHNTLQTL